MALRFMDGCDHYATADLFKKWSAGTGDTTQWSVGAFGRRSTSGLRISGAAAGAPRQLRRAFDNQPTWIVGCAFRATAMGANPTQILGVLDGATHQVSLRLNLDGTLTAMREVSTVLGSSTATIPVNTYVYVELLATIHNTAGVIRVRLNGTEVITLTSQNTRQTANNYANGIGIGSWANFTNVTFDFDDVYCCDGTGSAPHNGLLGDVRVETLFPTADGAYSGWTPSTGTTHYALVDESTPNTTDDVSSITVGQRDTYAMQDLSVSSGTIYGVQVNLAALKADAGFRPIKPLVLSGAAAALGPTQALTTSQLYYRQIQVTDPATGAAWTETGVNAMQCGVEVV